MNLEWDVDELDTMENDEHFLVPIFSDRSIGKMNESIEDQSIFFLPFYMPHEDHLISVVQHVQ